MPYCVECGGELKFDRKLKQYVCQSCGLTYTDTELLEARQRLLGVDEEDEKRKSREYLEWWFKSKKKE
jgi:putative hemolysin